MALRYNERTGMFDEVPDDPRINSFTFEGNPIRYNDESVTFHWDVIDSQRIYINDIEVPVNSTSYQYRLSEVGLKDFVLRIENGGNQKTETLQIKVIETPEFNVVQSCNKLRKGKNESCLIKWDIQNARSLKLKFGNTVEEIENFAERSVSPDSSTDYKFEVIGLDGERVFSYTVRVDVFEESTVLFEVDKNITLPHVPIKLSWDVKNASEVDLSGYGIVDYKGEEIIDCDREKVFTLKVTDVFGTTEYHQRIKMYPLPLIRSILVPTPQIERELKVETHFEQKHLQVNIKVNMAKIPDFAGIKADVFVHCIDFHKLSFPLTSTWKNKIDNYKETFSKLLLLKTSNSNNSNFLPHKQWWKSFDTHKNKLSKKIKNSISSLWNR